MRPWGPDLNLPEHRIIIGVPQSGKTTYARKLIARARRVIIFDPGHDYVDMSGADVVTVKEWPKSNYFNESMFRLVVIPTEDYDMVDEFVYTTKRVREIGDLVYVCDEVGDYNAGPGARMLRNLHRNGHKQGLVTILVSQRAVDIPLGARATASQVDSFLQDNEQDLEQLHLMYDGSAPGFSERVRHWSPGQPPVSWKRKVLYK